MRAEWVRRKQARKVGRRILHALDAVELLKKHVVRVAKAASLDTVQLSGWSSFWAEPTQISGASSWASHPTRCAVE